MLEPRGTAVDTRMAEIDGIRSGRFVSRDPKRFVFAR